MRSLLAFQTRRFTWQHLLGFNKSIESDHFCDLDVNKKLNHFYYFLKDCIFIGKDLTWDINSEIRVTVAVSLFHRLL